MTHKTSNKLEALQSLKAESHNRLSASDKIADCLTQMIGSMWFLNFNIILFIVWIIINLNIVPGISAIDPFPFEMLTTIVSLEAIVLSIVVLISQNNAAKLADMREEIDLHINTIAEREITKVIELVIKLAKKNGIEIDSDEELKAMLEPLDRRKIEKNIEKEIN